MRLTIRRSRRDDVVKVVVDTIVVIQSLSIANGSIWIDATDVDAASPHSVSATSGAADKVSRLFIPRVAGIVLLFGSFRLFLPLRFANAFGEEKSVTRSAYWKAERRTVKSAAKETKFAVDSQTMSHGVHVGILSITFRRLFCIR